MALVLAASVVALSVAMGVREGSEVRQYVHWLFVFGFAFTLASGLWLVVTILRSGRR
jgi:apolipoprotein N-acyltransferase